MATTHYALRIDNKGLDFDEIEFVLAQDSEAWVYGVEDQLSNNPHLHVFIETIKNQQTIRNHLRTLTGGGNGAYSLKKIDSTDEDFIKYFAYVLKQGNITASKSFFDNLHYQELWEEAQEYDEKVKEEIAQKKRDKKIPIWKKIMAEQLNTDRTDDETIMKAILQYHKDHELAIRVHQLKMYFDTIVFYRRYPDDVTQCYYFFYNHLFKN